jgi:membrane fusion protein
MTSSLFRPEVLEAQRGRWIGGISITQPLAMRMLAGFGLVAALLVMLVLVCGSYTRRSHVAGQLVAAQGTSIVPAPAAAVVVRIEAGEGSRVAAGQTLAVVRIPRGTVADGQTTEALQSRLRQRSEGLQAGHAAEQAVLAAQEAGLARQLRAARGELAQIEREVRTRQAQVELARDMLQRLDRLRQDGYVSELQVKQQQAAALAQQGEVQVLQRQALGSRRLVLQLEQAVRELPGQRLASQAAFQREQAALDQEVVETAARSELAVRAPVAGVVATQMFKPGQSVQAGQSMFAILPGDGRLEAELLVPSAAIGFINPGDRVLLRLQAFPYQKFGHQVGHVVSVSRDALNSMGAGAIAASGQRLEPYYRVSVGLQRQEVMAYGSAQPLKPGMLLEADILGERRRLIEWVFEPLYSLKGRLGED